MLQKFPLLNAVLLGHKWVVLNEFRVAVCLFKRVADWLSKMLWLERKRFYGDVLLALDCTIFGKKRINQSSKKKQSSFWL